MYVLGFLILEACSLNLESDVHAGSVHALFLHIRHEPDALASATCMWRPRSKFYLLLVQAQSKFNALSQDGHT
jgi:hypothetical protein